MSKPRPLLELTRTRVLLFLREPEAIFWVFIFPLVMAAVLGYAFRDTGSEPSPVLVMPGDGASELVATLGAAEGLEATLAEDAAAAEVALRNGAVDALLFPTADPTAPRLRLDSNRPEAELARLRVLLALGQPAPASGPTLEPVTEAGSRYVDFLFPGLLGLNLMGTGMWVIGFAVAELRQHKILKRLMVTPMRRSTFLFSFLLARLVFLALEVAALVAFGVWVLGVPFRAGVLAFALACLLGAMVFAGLGLLVTARARTIQGASGLLNVVMMPMWLISGVFFPYERFPEILHPVLRLLPLSALNDVLRAQMRDGAGLSQVGPELVILALWGGLSFLVALKIFRWE